MERKSINVKNFKWGSANGMEKLFWESKIRVMKFLGFEEII